MKKTLPYVTGLQGNLVEDAICRIVETIQPAEIICYGVRTQTTNRWTSFKDEQPTGAVVISIDLLIILHEKDKSRRDSVSERVSNFSDEQLKLIAIVHSLNAVRNNLQEDNVFFVNIYQKGIHLFESNTACLPIFSKSCFQDVRPTPFHEVTQRKADLAKLFYDTAYDCATDQRNDIAAFLLHQAVELSCIALIRTSLGYIPTTHSIKRLFMLTENITGEIHEIFPASTKEERDLFHVLQRAYSDVRYKDRYGVSGDVVFILLDRVYKLQSLVSRLCQISHHENQEQIA